MKDIIIAICFVIFIMYFGVQKLTATIIYQDCKSDAQYMQLNDPKISESIKKRFVEKNCSEILFPKE